MRKNETHHIQIDGAYGTQVFKQRLSQDQYINDEGLKHRQTVAEHEQQNIIGVAHVVNQLQNDAIIEHPVFDLKCVVNKNLNPAVVYKLSCGTYLAQQQSMVREHIKENEKVLDIGAGIGISSVIAAQQSGQEVLALEPNEDLHKFILKNADANRVAIKVRKGCVVAQQNQGETEFHITKEPWSSSIFADKTQNVERVDRVPVCNIDGLIDEHKANVLLVDIHGAELGLFNAAKLTAINTLILTIDTPMIGEIATSDVISSLTSKGFNLKDFKGWTFVFTRTV